MADVEVPAPTPTPVAAPAPEAKPVAETTKETKPPSAPVHFEDSDGLFKTVCRLFMKKKCKNQNCKYVHDKQLCPHYWKTGTCKYGEDCKLNHFVTIPEKKHATTENTPAVADKTDGESKAEMKKAAKKDKKESKKKDKEEKKKKENEDHAKKEAKEQKKEDEKKEKDKKEKKKQKEKRRPTKKNTECFEPMAKPVDLRITYDLGTAKDTFSTPLTSRDVVLVPNLFSDFKKGELYAKLIAELDACGIPKERLLKMWHGNDKIDGTHLIVDDKTRWKTNCPTFTLITDRIQNFFKLSIKATRFNWYKDTSQWKPFHFDAAAVKPDIAAIQNFTVGVSFGATRDAAFEHAETKTVVSVPQPDGCVYCFAKDTNILWRHGILQDVPVRDEGRISVIAWGWIDGMTDPEATVTDAVE